MSRAKLRVGYDAATTEMIATAASVSNQTICRVGEPRADLVLDAFLEHAKTDRDVTRATGGSSLARHGGKPWQHA
jgi:hypothetical protein